MENLRNIIEKFRKTKILVIGDLILDEYIWGEVERISPEAPVPVVWARKRSFSLGGAANVANNLRSLGAEVSLVGIVGKDINAEILLEELKKKKIDTEGIFRDQRPTTLKTRIIAGHQQVTRLDWEETNGIPTYLISKIIKFLSKDIADFDAIIIEDYGKGLITSDLLSKIKSMALDKKKIISVDPKEENFHLYKDVTCITPNRKEAENAIRNIKIKDENNRLEIYTDKLLTDEDIDLAGIELLKYLNCKGLLITLGERGMRLFERGKKPRHIDTLP
jgi:rfaE bifunctional protein kinase chain/domain